MIHRLFSHFYKLYKLFRVLNTPWQHDINNILLWEPSFAWNFPKKNQPNTNKAKNIPMVLPCSPINFEANRLSGS